MFTFRTRYRCSSHDRTTENLFEPCHMSVLLGCNLWTQLSITSRSSKLDFVLFISVHWNESEYREKWSNSCCLSGSIWDAQQPKLPWAARTCFFVHLLSITSYSVCSRQKLDRSPSSRCRHTHKKNNLIAVKRCTTCMCYSKPHVQLESRKNPFKKYLKLASRFKRLQYLCKVGV